MLLTKDGEHHNNNHHPPHHDQVQTDQCMNGDISNNPVSTFVSHLQDDRMNSFLAHGPPTTCSFQDYLDDSLDNEPFSAPDFGSHAQIDLSSSPEGCKDSASPGDGSADENSMIPNCHPNGAYPVLDHFITDQTQQDLGYALSHLLLRSTDRSNTGTSSTLFLRIKFGCTFSRPKGRCQGTPLMLH